MNRWARAALAVGIGYLAITPTWTPDIPADVLRDRYASPTSQFLDVADDFTVHVRDEGRRDAPALFLVHGSNASLHTWEPWVERLGDRFRIVSLDLQGHGLTGTRDGLCYSPACMASTVERVRAELGIERLAIAGNSMGGRVAAQYALGHPERVEALVLVAASGAPVAQPGRLPIGFELARIPVVRDIAVRITPRFLVEQTLERSVSVPAVASEAAVTRYWELLRHPGNREATLERSTLPRTPYRVADLKPLRRIPTLILWGEEDRLLPVEGAQWFAGAIPGARKIVYRGIGHLPQEEAPDATAAEVAAFLARARQPPPA